ncbi:hypothetical protein Tco_0238531 [Tanacetum coccineum]
MPRATGLDHQKTRNYIPLISNELCQPLLNTMANLENDIFMREGLLFKYVVSVSLELAFDLYLSHDRAMHLLAPHYERKTRADRGKKRPRESNASSSSTTQNQPSSFLPLDHMVDENDDESFHSNSSSHSQQFSPSSNVASRVR